MNRDIPYNFGAVKLPPGYAVIWHECHEHYQGHGPDEWETPITCRPHQAREWCVRHWERRQTGLIEAPAQILWPLVTED